MQPTAPIPAPALWQQMQVSGLFLCWQWLLDGYSVGFIFFSRLCCLWDPKTPHRSACEMASYCLEASPPSPLPPKDRSPSLTLCLSFHLLYFVLPPFQENGLSFWVTGVLWQHSEVVLWELLSIQMIFWWICGRESGFLVLFLHHLGTLPPPPPPPPPTPILLSQSLETAILFSVSRNLPALGTSSKGSHVIPVPLWPASYFT